MRNRLRTTVLGMLSLVVTGGAAPQATTPADQEARTRQLWNEKFLDKRPAAEPAKARPPAKKARSKQSPPPEAHRLDPQTKKAVDETSDALVGITLWRLDPGKSEPVRIAANSPLVEGQRIRVSIETPREGYLYVIDREQYKDGSFSVPVLIFPTTRTHGGKNDVKAGRLVEIPAWADTPPYFTMSVSRPDQVAEVLTVLVTPEPLPDLTIGTEPVKLAAEQVTTWEKQWGGKVKRLEARGEAGKPYTKAEREAGMERTRLLRHDEPLPQTMYLCEDVKPGAPLLVNVPLQIKK